MVDSEDTNRKKIAILVHKNDNQAVSPELDSPCSGRGPSLQRPTLDSQIRPSTNEEVVNTAAANKYMSGRCSKESDNSWNVKRMLLDSHGTQGTQNFATRNNKGYKEQNSLHTRQKTNGTDASGVKKDSDPEETPRGKRYPGGRNSQ